MDRRGLIQVARGDRPADLVLRNARVVNTFTAEIEAGHVAIYQDRVAGVGDYRHGNRVVDLRGQYLVPGLINGHTHLESSLLDVGQYARAVVPRGVTAVVTDLHEIANVCGLAGLRYVVDASRSLPLDLFLMAPSCVPATSLETAGARLGIEEIRTILRWRNTLGLGEVMQFPDAISGDPDLLQEVAAAGQRPIDGHAPGVTGKSLNAYVAAGMQSCHESTTLEEGREKLRHGLYLMIREGSSEKNLATLLPLVTDGSYNRCLLVVDDRHCVDLLKDGDIDAVVRQAIALGLEPVRAIQMATINPARYFGLTDLGAIAPGYAANFFVVDDLPTLDARMVFYHGKLVGEERRALFTPAKSESQMLTQTMHVQPFSKQRLALPDRPGPFPVIGIVPGQIVTEWLSEEPTKRQGRIVADPSRDLLKVVVVERHRASGNIGIGLVKGFGLRQGALASSVAHDSHNIVAVGASDEDLYAAVTEVERLGGGLVVAANGAIIEALSLPIAGLLSPQPLEVVAAQFERLEQAAAGLGTSVAAPFAVLSFLALPVIPALRLTDRGLVDVAVANFVASP